MIQRRNVSHSILHQPDLFRNGIQYLQEPIGGFGVWNGQFEQPAFDSATSASGWEIYPNDANSVMERVTGGAAGNWCFRGGNSQPNARGGYLWQLCYMPVWESRLYNVYCCARSSTGAETFYFGAVCYSAARANLGIVNVVAAVAPPVAWTAYSGSIGPAGTVAWLANTRYARLFLWLQWNNALAANTFVYVDDVGFWPANL